MSFCAALPQIGAWDSKQGSAGGMPKHSENKLFASMRDLTRPFLIGSTPSPWHASGLPVVR